MKSWFSVCLGTWHPYKQANIVVWTTWVQRWIGPLYHEICPAGNVPKKPKLIVASTFFTYMRLAYPKFRGQLEGALARHQNNQNDPEIYAALLDLHQLFEFFIPVVFDLSCVFAHLFTVTVFRFDRHHKARCCLMYNHRNLPTTHIYIHTTRYKQKYMYT